VTVILNLDFEEKTKKKKKRKEKKKKKKMSQAMTTTPTQSRIGQTRTENLVVTPIIRRHPDDPTEVETYAQRYRQSLLLAPKKQNNGIQRKIWRM
jgi:UbiD family decarboxylase